MGCLTCTVNFVFSFNPIAFSLLPTDKEKMALSSWLSKKNHSFTNVSLFFFTSKTPGWLRLYPNWISTWYPFGKRALQAKELLLLYWMMAWSGITQTYMPIMWVWTVLKFITEGVICADMKVFSSLGERWAAWVSASGPCFLPLPGGISRVQWSEKQLLTPCVRKRDEGAHINGTVETVGSLQIRSHLEQ